MERTRRLSVMSNNSLTRMLSVLINTKKTSIKLLEFYTIQVN